MKTKIFLMSFVLLSIINVYSQIPTNEWVSFYSGQTTLDGQPVPVGTVIKAFDPSNVLCGIFTVTLAGHYGFLQVYRDDITTPTIDEGAEPGDTITFKINDNIATPLGPASSVWTFNGDVKQLNLEALTSIQTFQLAVNVTNGWNMVSIPGLHPSDQNVSTWWQYRDLGANVFRYSGGYQPVTVAAPGIGYWMKHSGARTYNTGDEWPAAGIQIVSHNPLTGASGWNIIGGYEISATTSLVTTIPAGQQSGPIYKYSGGYQIATTIDPGYGYWIKLLSAAQIIIPETMAKGSATEFFPEYWGRIILTDATGINYTLYAVKGEVNLSQYDLPPAPPTGMFDIRFSSGRIAEDINSSIKTIDMSGVTYPLTVRVEGMDIRLMDETGKNVNVNLKSGEDVVISDATISKLKVSGELVPTVYALGQNFPNPFNPSTKIRFSIPNEVQVNLSVFNILGERVTELKNENLKPGYYEVEFNASNLASGIYIYRIKAGDFIDGKKMILIK